MKEYFPLLFPSKFDVHSIDPIHGWLHIKEANLLYRLAENASNAGCIVEIGSWKGRSTIPLALGSKAGTGQTVYAIDPHAGLLMRSDDNKNIKSTLDEFVTNIQRAGVDDIVSVQVDTSENAVAEWSQPIAVLWIDGLHDYHSVDHDCTQWSPYLVDGGVIAFHDADFAGIETVFFKRIMLSREFGQISFVCRTLYAVKKRSFAGSKWLIWCLWLLLKRYRSVRSVYRKAKRHLSYKRILATSYRKS